MVQKCLYAVYLGGKVKDGELAEDHKLVFVVADCDSAARKQAKEKWDAMSVHVDGTQQVVKVDGYKITLKEDTGSGDDYTINTEYST